MLLLNLFEFQYSVVLFLLVIRIALWPIVGKELFPWLFTCAVFILVQSYCRCRFPVWCLGPDVEFDYIGSFYLLNFGISILRLWNTWHGV